MFRKALMISAAVTLFAFCMFAEAKPTIYMKNENDKLEPVLMPVSSTVIPIPVGHYRVSAGIGIKSNSKHKKVKLTKPEGPIKLITAAGLKKPATLEGEKA